MDSGHPVLLNSSSNWIPWNIWEHFPAAELQSEAASLSIAARIRSISEVEGGGDRLIWTCSLFSSFFTLSPGSFITSRTPRATCGFKLIQMSVSTSTAYHSLYHVCVNW